MDNNFSSTPTPNQAFHYNYVDYKAPIRSTANKIGIVLIITIAISFLISIILGIVYQFNADVALLYDQTTFIGQVFNITTYVVTYAIPIFIGYKLLNIPANVAFPFRKPETDVLIGSIGVGIGVVVFGTLIVSFVYSVVVLLTGLAPVYPFDYTPRGIPANIAFFINIAILPAFFEELLFRGIIMQSLRRYGDSVALIASSIIFGLAHGNLIQAPNAIVGGLVIGYFVLYSGSLWPGIAMHFVNNASSVIFQWVNLNNTTDQEQNLSIIVFLARILIGIVALVYFKVKKGSLFFVPPSKYPLEENKKYTTIFTSITMILYTLIIIYFTYTNLEPAPDILT